jgi:hypothetical protein
VAESPTDAIPIAQPTGIAFDLPCFFCSYNLRTLTLGGICPECGRPVQDTFQHGWLIFADKRWLGKLHRGISLILCALLASIGYIWGFVGMDGTKIFEPGGLKEVVGLTVFTLVYALGLAATWLWTACLLTSPEPRLTKPAPRADLGIWVRVLTGISIALPVLFALAGALFLIVERELHWGLTAVVMLCGWALCVLVSVLLLMMHVRRIARRDLQKGLGRLMSFLIWGFGAIIAPAIVAFLLALGSNASGYARFAFPNLPGNATSQASGASMPAVTTNRPSTTAGMPTTTTGTLLDSDPKFLSCEVRFTRSFRNPPMPLFCGVPLFALAWLIAGFEALVSFRRLITRAIRQTGLPDLSGCPCGLGRRLPPGADPPV